MVRAITREVSYHSPLAEPDALLADIREHCDDAAPGVSVELSQRRASREAGHRVRRECSHAPGASRGSAEPVLHSFRVGHQVVWQAILRQADRVQGGRTAAILLVEPSIHYTDAMSTLVADVYVREQQRELTAADRLRRDVLELLLQTRRVGSRRHGAPGSRWTRM